MRVSRIYVDTPLSQNSRVLFADQTAHYVKNVLRLKSAAPVILFDGMSPMEYSANLSIVGKKVYADITVSRQPQTESPLKTTLIQALGKSDHMDFLIQKSTELGIHQILIFNSEYTQSPLKASRLEKKLAHWKKISISACEQCGRTNLPDISFQGSLLRCIEALPADNRILLDFEGRTFNRLSDNLSAFKPFNLLVGAEGGLSEMEIVLAKKNGFIGCNLGPRILRMETAGISMLSLVQLEFGDFQEALSR